MRQKLQKFFPLVKVDLDQHIVYGLVTAEVLDKDGEVCDYATTKPEYQKVNDEIGKASGGENIMPLREMHQLNAVGAGKSIDFDDERKQIRMGFKVVDDSTWKKVVEKVLLGFSQGGRYLKRWKQDGKDFYTAQPGEVSLVDNPCLPGAFIEYSKADGVEMYQAMSRFSKETKYLVADGNHLPYTDESGKPDHNRMGAAWAALHGGYRGNTYEGPGKEQAIARLKEIYHSEGMTPPSEKALKLLSISDVEDSDLDTALAKFEQVVAEIVGQLDSKGSKMNPEQIKKAAAALGMTEADFLKMLSEDSNLSKAKKGLAALGHHLKKAHAHHTMMKSHYSKIGDMHKAHADHHATMADHLEDCMKAHAACDDDGEADKILRALGNVDAPKLVLIGKTADGVEVFRKEGTAAVTLEGLSDDTSDMKKAIKAAIDEATKPLLTEIETLKKELGPQNGGTNGAHLKVFDRQGNEISKADKAATPEEAMDPCAV